MAEITDSTPLPTAGNTPDGDIKWVRSASDVSRLVNDGSQGRANARIVVGIALGEFSSMPTISARWHSASKTSPANLT